MPRHTPISMSMSIALPFVVCALLATASPARTDECQSIPPRFSTSTLQFTTSGSLFPQNVYVATAPTATAPGAASFLPFSANLDALDLIDDTTLRFSVDRNAYVLTSSGLVRLIHDRPYRLDTSGGVLIQPDPDWVALGLSLGSLNAVYAGPGGCFTFSTAVSRRLRHGGATVNLRPWQLYRACPAAPLELVFDAGSLGVLNLDAVHMVAGIQVEFSTAADRLMPAGRRIWNQNVYRCVPQGPDRTCAPETLGTAFDGVSAGLTDLDAFSGDDLEVRVQLEHVREHQAAFQAIADANGGTRTAGTAGHDESVDYVAAVLETAGYDVTIQPLSYFDWRRDGPQTLEQVAPIPTSYILDADYVPMEHSESGDVTAPVTAVDLDLVDPALATSGCEAADFAGFPAGHLALIQRGSCTFLMKAENAAAAGALGVIFFNQGDSASRTGLFSGTLTEDYSASLPVVASGFDRGVEWATTPGLVMHMVVDAFRGTVSTANLLAETSGGRDDHVVMVGAALDSPPVSPGIQDNGSGSAVILETALQLACVETTNRVRFAWWSGKGRYGPRGSPRYIGQLTPDERDAIAVYLNVDAVGSPNFARFVYDGDGSDGGAAGPPGSAAIEALLEAYYADRGLASESIGLGLVISDHFAFRSAGIPTGGVFAGRSGIKSAAQVSLYGGTAGDAYDPCSSLACDTFDNVSLEALEVNSDAVAHATQHLALTP